MLSSWILPGDKKQWTSSFVNHEAHDPVYFTHYFDRMTDGYTISEVPNNTLTSLSDKSQTRIDPIVHKINRSKKENYSNL